MKRKKEYSLSDVNLGELHLKQVTQPYAWERDHITGDYIPYGHFYYEDETSGFIV